MKQYLNRIIKQLIAAQQRRADRRIAEMYLYRMSERELRDIGISKNDIKRVVHG